MRKATPEALTQATIRAVVSDPASRAVLERMPSLRLPEWWLTAGAVFQNVWNAVEGRPPGYGIKDYDVFYFDDTDVSWEAEDAIIRRSQAMFRDLGVTVEVRNEARVHLWYEEKFGVPAPAFRSATDAIDSFAASTCCVGITRDDATGFRVYAPFGLEDVFALRMRPNRTLAPQRVYETKVEQYRSRWPSLIADPW